MFFVYHQIEKCTHLGGRLQLYISPWSNMFILIINFSTTRAKIRTKHGRCYNFVAVEITAEFGLAAWQAIWIPFKTFCQCCGNTSFLLTLLSAPRELALISHFVSIIMLLREHRVLGFVMIPTWTCCKYNIFIAEEFTAGSLVLSGCVFVLSVVINMPTPSQWKVKPYFQNIWDTIKQQFPNLRSRAGHFTISLKISAHLEFDGSSTSQKSWNRSMFPTM